MALDIDGSSLDKYFASLDMDGSFPCGLQSEMERLVAELSPPHTAVRINGASHEWLFA